MAIDFNAACRRELVEAIRKECVDGWEAEYCRKLLEKINAVPNGRLVDDDFDESDIEDEEKLTPVESVLLSLGYFGLTDKYYTP